MASVFHISEEDATRDFGAVLARAHIAGSIVIDCANGCEVLLQIQGSTKSNNTDCNIAEDFIPGRTVEEILTRLALWEAGQGPIVIDEGFADDVAKAHEHLNRPLSSSSSSKWD